MLTVHPETIDMIDRISHGNYMDPVLMIAYLSFVINLARAIRRLP